MTVALLLGKNGGGAVHPDGKILAWSSRIDPSVRRY
jgi:hypothetical protein